MVKCHFIKVQQPLVLKWKVKLSDVYFAERDILYNLQVSVLPVWSVQAKQFLS